MIGDYLEHQELLMLEQDRVRYFKEGKKDEEYIPTDFDAYSIISPALIQRLDTVVKEEELSKDENIWRVSSLTAYLDEDTKILLLPKLDSKRKVKVIDTVYKLNTYSDLIKAS